MSATEETVNMKLFLSEVTTIPSRTVRTATKFSHRCHSVGQVKSRDDSLGLVLARGDQDEGEGNKEDDSGDGQGDRVDPPSPHQRHKSSSLRLKYRSNGKMMLLTAMNRITFPAVDSP